MKDNNINLGSFTSTNLGNLTIPKESMMYKTIISDDIATQLKLLGQQVGEALKNQQSAFTGLAPQLSEIAKTIEMNYKPQVLAFQSIAKSLQPLIGQQAAFSLELSKLSNQISPSINAIETLSSYNSFNIYKETYEEFGGELDPDNITDEEIRNTFNNNKEIIQEVNEVVLQAENEGVPLENISELIYNLLIKKIPFINKRTYSVLILIFCSSILIYELYSAHSTNTTLDETIVPTLERHTEVMDKLSIDIKEIKGITNENSDDLKELKKQSKNNQNSIESLKDDIVKSNEQVNDIAKSNEQINDKVEMILKEMRKNNEKE